MIYLQVLKQILPVDKARKKDEDKETKVRITSNKKYKNITYRKLRKFLIRVSKSTGCLIKSLQNRFKHGEITGTTLQISVDTNIPTTPLFPGDNFEVSNRVYQLLAITFGRL